jgi:hypothetical protein
MLGIKFRISKLNIVLTTCLSESDSRSAALFPHSIEHDATLSCSQHYTTGPCPELDASSLQPPDPALDDAQ